MGQFYDSFEQQFLVPEWSQEKPKVYSGLETDEGSRVEIHRVTQAEQGYTGLHRAHGGANKGEVGVLEGGERICRELNDTKLGKGKDNVCISSSQLHNAVLSIFAFQLH